MTKKYIHSHITDPSIYPMKLILKKILIYTFFVSQFCCPKPYVLKESKFSANPEAHAIFIYSMCVRINLYNKINFEKL